MAVKFSNFLRIEESWCSSLGPSWFDHLLRLKVLHLIFIQLCAILSIIVQCCAKSLIFVVNIFDTVSFYIYAIEGTVPYQLKLGLLLKN